MTLGILCGLSAYIWQTGGVAFSPGKLSSKGQPGVVLEEFSSHAEFEGECRRCHAPMETTQDQLCLACHQRMADQINLQSGTHAEIDHVSRCAECHTDHRGQDYDPTQGALAQFDHSQTKFSLLRHYVDYTAAPMD